MRQRDQKSDQSQWERRDRRHGDGKHCVLLGPRHHVRYWVWSGEPCGNLHSHRIGTRNKGNRKLRVGISLWLWAPTGEAAVGLGAGSLVGSPWEHPSGGGRRKLTQAVPSGQIFWAVCHPRVSRVLQTGESRGSFHT